MLFILFQIGTDRYALDARELVEVLPLMHVKHLPHAPAGITGVLDYRGTPVPVIDLSAMAVGRSASQRLSTRILVVQCADGTRLALVAERVNEMLKREAADFVESGVTLQSAAYLGPVTRDARGLVQWVRPESLLTSAVRDAVCHQLAEAA